MSGGGQSTTTTKNALPSWAVPYAQGLLGMGSQLYAPGGQPGQMPANMQQQVAGMTPDQIQAMSMIQQRTGGPAISNIPDQSVMPTGTTPGSALPSQNATNPQNQTVQGVTLPATPQGGVNNPPVAASPPAPPPAPPTAPPTKTKKPAKPAKKKK